jgi:hypothetical protein
MLLTGSMEDNTGQQYWSLTDILQQTIKYYQETYLNIKMNE